MNFHEITTFSIKISKVAYFIDVSALWISAFDTVLLPLGAWNFIDAAAHRTLVSNCCGFDFFSLGCIAVYLRPTYTVTIS